MLGSRLGLVAQIGHARLRRVFFDALVAQGDDELRHLRARVDHHVDAVDHGRAARARLQVLDLELAADLEELEVRADLELLRAAAADASLHRRAEAVDVQAHARAGLAFDGFV